MLRFKFTFDKIGYASITQEPSKENLILDSKTLIYCLLAYISKFFSNRSDGRKAVYDLLQKTFATENFSVENVEEYFSKTILDWTAPDYVINDLSDKQREAAIQMFKSGEFRPPSKLLQDEKIMYDDLVPSKIGSNNLNKKYTYIFTVHQSNKAILNLKMNGFAPHSIIYPMSVLLMIEYGIRELNKSDYNILQSCIIDLLKQVNSDYCLSLISFSKILNEVCIDNDVIPSFLNAKSENLQSVQQDKKSENDSLYGLGGWLALFQIRIFVALLSFFLQSLSIYDIYTPVYIIIIDFSPIILLIVCLIQFYKKKMAFRLLYIIATIILILTNLCMYFIFVYYDGLINAISGTIVESLVILYLFKSKRVKNTFSANKN